MSDVHPNAPAPTPARLDRWIPTLLVLVVVAWGAAVGFEKIRNFDYWWHLATGEWIAAHGEVPRVDPFTYTVEGRRWIDLHWLFQVGLVRVHGLGGHEAVRVAKGLLVLLTLGLAAWSGFRRERAGVIGLGVVLLAVIGSSRFLARPDLVSFALLAAALGLLFRHEARGGRAVFALVPLQLLWANVHGLFAVGLAVQGMALASEIGRPWILGEPLRRDHAARLAAVLALSGLVSLANPNGLDGALFPLVQLGMIGSWEDRGLFGRAINELQPTLGLDPIALLPSAILAALVAAGLAANRRRLGAFDVLLFVAFLYLALTARRNLALFALVAVPLLARNLGAAVERGASPARVRVASAAGLAILAAGGAVFAAGQIAPARRHEGMSSPALMPARYPERAVDWIERERPPGPIYHRMPDGGYLIARLYPAYRDMVDGRLEVFGAARFAELEDGTPEGFQRLDARHRFGTALVHHTFFHDETLLTWLWQSPAWRPVHLDESAAVFVRVAPGAEPGWPAVDPGDPALFPPLDDRERASLDLWRRHARIRLLATLGEHGRALALADETLARYRDPRIETLRGWLRERAPIGR